MVHPVQRHRRRRRLPGRSAGGRGEFPRRRPALVAAGHPARHPALFRHRRDHRFGRPGTRPSSRRSPPGATPSSPPTALAPISRRRRTGQHRAHGSRRRGDVGLRHRATVSSGGRCTPSPAAAPASAERRAPDGHRRRPRHALLEVHNCRQAYHKDSNADLLVLDDVNLAITPAEIVGLLGRSGSGKSTLLRIVSGLLMPTAGDVRWRGTAVSGPADGVAMVFQSFALFPWLTVQRKRRARPGSAGRAPRRTRQAGRGSRSTSSASAATRAPTPRNSPAACASASGWPARSWSTPTCS